MNILSVPSPLRPGSNSTLFYYDLVNRLPPLESCLNTHGAQYQSLNPGILALFTLSSLNAMRISETLAITKGDEYIPTMFQIPGRKGSRDYSVHIPISTRNRAVLNSWNSSIVLFPYNYKRVWDSLIRVGLSVKLPRHSNRTVTHQGRFNLVAKVKYTAKQTNLSDLLRHNSDKSLRYYDI